MAPVQPHAVWKGVIEEEAMWAYADQGSYKMALRKAYKNHDKMKTVACELCELNKDKFSDEKLFEGFVEQLHEFENPDAWLSEIEDIIKDYE